MYQLCLEIELCLIQLRDIPFIFIGYPYSMKDYKFFSLHTHSVIISRHAIFHETFFPYVSHLDHSSFPWGDIDISSLKGILSQLKVWGKIVNWVVV
jgi:hypothetical protein